jgi:hypothetical protein
MGALMVLTTPQLSVLGTDGTGWFGKDVVLSCGFFLICPAHSCP